MLYNRNRLYPVEYDDYSTLIQIPQVEGYLENYNSILRILKFSKRI